MQTLLWTPQSLGITPTLIQLKAVWPKQTRRKKAGFDHRIEKGKKNKKTKPKQKKKKTRA